MQNDLMYMIDIIILQRVCQFRSAQHPVTPMQNAPQQMMTDWQSMPNTMLEDQVMSNHAMAAQTHSFPVPVPVTLNWDQLGQYNGQTSM